MFSPAFRITTTPASPSAGERLTEAEIRIHEHYVERLTAAEERALAAETRLAEAETSHLAHLREWQDAHHAMLLRAEQAEARVAEITRAVTEALRGMDRAGGDACGMPECPWCHREDAGTEDQPETERHDADCELLALRSLLSGEGT